MARTVILSDTHLGGHRAPTPAQLQPLWSGARRLVINGDVAEVHHPVFRGAAARAILDLQDRCAADGVQLTLLSGNHDAYLDDRRHLFFDDERVLVMHGDALHRSIAPWSGAAKRMRRARDAALEATETPTLETILEATQHAGHVEWADATHVCPTSIGSLLLHPWRAVSILGFWKTFASRADAFAKRWCPRTQFMVLGHSHRAGIWSVGGRVIINTGSFGRPGRPRAVMIDDGQLSVLRIASQQGGWRYAGRPVAEFTWPTPCATPARPTTPEPAAAPDGPPPATPAHSASRTTSARNSRDEGVRPRTPAI